MIETIASKIKLAHWKSTEIGDKKQCGELTEEYRECLKDIEEKYEFDGDNHAKMFAVLVYKDIVDNCDITTTITKNNNLTSK